ncbi:MAG: hypothetical protein ACK5KL_08530 [Dysgonomonas sp.]|jgi:hypothetical protein|nr:hypothetical protein [Prevotella sp.]MDR3059719.1 hypothetical protein [Prevotella sp.]
MENLIKKLQDEAGLTTEQAVKAVSIVKDYMDKEGLDIDWDKFFKGKTEDFLSKARNLFSDVSKQTQSYTDKFVDKVDDIADKARKKASDFFDEK